MIRLSTNRPNLPTVIGRYEFTHPNGSKKFWEIEFMNPSDRDSGKSIDRITRHFRVRYGKVGKGGTFSQWKMCKENELNKLVFSKIRKGYRFVNATPLGMQGNNNNYIAHGHTLNSKSSNDTQPVQNSAPHVHKAKEVYSEFYLLEEFDYDSVG